VVKIQQAIYSILTNNISKKKLLKQKECSNSRKWS